MRVQLTIDLDRLLRDKKARKAFEQFFTSFPPKADELAAALKMDRRAVNEMLGYVIVKTILDDDGTGRSYRVLDLPEKEKVAGK